MDAFGIASSAISAIQVAISIGRLLSGYPAFKNSGDEWEQILSRDSGYLSIIDVSIKKETHSKILTTCKIHHSRDRDSVKAALDSLPSQEITSFRVYIEENLRSNETLNTHIAQVVSDSFFQNPDLPATNSFIRLMSQCRPQKTAEWWATHSYDFVSRDSARLFRNTNSSRLLSAALIKCSKRIRIANDRQDRLIVFVSCVTEMMVSQDVSKEAEARVYERILFRKLKSHEHAPSRPSQSSVFENLDKFSQEIAGSDEIYSGINANDASTDIIRAMMILRFCHIGLKQFSHMLDFIQLFYSATRNSISDTRRTIITLSSLEEITKDEYLYKHFWDCISDLASATESLVGILAAKLMNNGPFQILAIELRATCVDLKRTTSRLSTRIEDHLKFFELGRSLSESSRLWLLSILASVFLPLSLASSILSMQTRLVKLHYLLYDFCGLLVIFGSIAVGLIFILRLYVSWTEKVAGWNNNAFFRKTIRPVMELILGTLMLLGWLLITSSFLVGMIMDAGLGLKILGYGSAAIGGSMVVAVFGAVIAAGVIFLM